MGAERAVEILGQHLDELLAHHVVGIDHGGPHRNVSATPRPLRMTSPTTGRADEPRRSGYRDFAALRGDRPLGALRRAGARRRARRRARALARRPADRQAPAEPAVRRLPAGRGHAERLGGVPRRARRAPRGGRGGDARAPHADQRAGALRAAAPAAGRAPAAAGAARGRRERRASACCPTATATTTPATASATGCCAARPRATCRSRTRCRTSSGAPGSTSTRSTSPIPTRCAGSNCSSGPGRSTGSTSCAARSRSPVRDPPRVIEGDLTTDLPALAAEAPQDATLVIFHTAVLATCPPAGRERSATALTGALDRLRGAARARPRPRPAEPVRARARRPARRLGRPARRVAQLGMNSSASMSISSPSCHVPSGPRS